ncbi:MAG: N-methyl-L-tryptophan oxidase, partial [Gemmatimonadetes bacterium]|nr:N-methyl-L-tryptophan oxidase [Gemmatimonadota bacterium]
MAKHYDVIVVGLGGMGSAALYHLAKAGRRVLGVERFGIPHEMGSSHGLTRIIRLAYFEHPDYVPLLRRSYELWDELEAIRGETLLVKTGSLDVSDPDDDVFRGSLDSCERHGLVHETLTANEVRARFPAYRLWPEAMAVYQPDGGFLVPERCIEAHVEAARRHGAEARTHLVVDGWEETGSGVEVTTDQGVYHGDALVLTAGAWTSDLTSLAAHLEVERQVLVWFETKGADAFTPQRFPVFNIRGPFGHYYGFPEYGIPGVKVGKYHHLAEVVDPDTVGRDTSPMDEAPIRSFMESVFPDAAGVSLKTKVCLFTNTPDEHFIVD